MIKPSINLGFGSVQSSPVDQWPWGWCWGWERWGGISWCSSSHSQDQSTPSLNFFLWMDLCTVPPDLKSRVQDRHINRDLKPQATQITPSKIQDVGWSTHSKKKNLHPTHLSLNILHPSIQKHHSSSDTGNQPLHQWAPAWSDHLHKPHFFLHYTWVDPHQRARVGLYIYTLLS